MTELSALAGSERWGACDDVGEEEQRSEGCAVRDDEATEKSHFSALNVFLFFCISVRPWSARVRLSYLCNVHISC